MFETVVIPIGIQNGSCDIQRVYRLTLLVEKGLTLNTEKWIMNCLLLERY